MAVGELMQRLQLSGGNHSDNTPATDADLEQINLTDEETQTAIKLAKIDKYWQLQELKKKEKVEAFVNEIKRPWNAQEMFNYLHIRAKELKLKKELDIDEYNRYVIEALCYYFTNDKHFETLGVEIFKGKGPEQWKLDKGIFIYGDVGTGKTTIMKLFARNKRQCFDVHSCPEVVTLFLQEGHKKDSQMDVIGDVFAINRPEYNDARYFYHKQVGKCFDDLGKEEVANLYGNRRNVLAEILDARYNNRYSYGFECTHLTTNLNREKLEAMYGTRIWSRIREMFNLIHIGGPDRRINE